MKKSDHLLDHEVNRPGLSESELVHGEVCIVQSLKYNCSALVVRSVYDIGTDKAAKSLIRTLFKYLRIFKSLPLNS